MMVEVLTVWSITEVEVAILSFYLIDHKSKKGKDCTIPKGN